LKQVFALPTVEEIYSKSDDQAPEALHCRLVVDDPNSQWYIPNNDPSAWIATHIMRKCDGRHTIEFTVHGQENNVLTMLDQPTMLRKLPKLLFTYMLQEQRYKL
jgi:hypothetical protein